MLKGLQEWDIFSLIDFPEYTPPEETGKTFEENARIKAEHASRALNAWVLADDSGLVIPSLKGAPGVYSAYYAGPNATDKDNRNKLLEEMKELNDEARDGYFECCLALADPSGVKKSVCALCEGTITKKERGGQGFGYDNIFQKHEYSKTFSELEDEVKNRISHRRKALDKMLLTLEAISVPD
jgi:XTP/dITP diphosphohydrolase